MKNDIKKFNLLDICKLLFWSLLVAMLASFIISQKENLDLDEVYTYGLANSHFQLDVEDFNDYNGNDILLDYASAKEPYLFNVQNVFFNQSMDTHPPLYYILVNFVCSLHPNNFSMWYGLSINIFFIVLVFWQMKYLLNFFIKNELLSCIITFLSFTLNGFANAIVFTRMYVMLMCVSLATFILIFNEINEVHRDASKNDTKNEIIFLSKYFIINVIGILTQYHYIIIAMLTSIYYAIYLIKNKKYKTLILTIIVGVLSVLAAIIIFPAMINHLFSSSSLHTVTSNSQVNIANNFYELLITIYKSFFNVGIYVYLFLIILTLIINVILHKIKSINKTFLMNFLSLITLIVIYYIIVSLTTEWSFARYLYNIYPYLTIVITLPIYYLCKNISNKLVYVIPIMLLSLCFFSTLQNLPSSLNVGDYYFETEYLNKNKNVNMLLLYRTVDKNGNVNTMGTTSKWKLPRPIYLFRDMKHMTFVDVSDINKLRNSQVPALNNQNDTILVIYTTEDDNALINELMKKNNYRYCNKVYFTLYTHIYRLN